MYWGHPFLRHEFGWHFAAGAIIGILLLILLVLLIVWAVRRWKRAPMSVGQGPIDIARERYARGEISLAEFEEIKKNLT
jgi:putative membrane protein